MCVCVCSCVYHRLLSKKNNLSGKTLTCPARDPGTSKVEQQNSFRSRAQASDSQDSRQWRSGAVGPPNLLERNKTIALPRALPHFGGSSGPRFPCFFCARGSILHAQKLRFCAKEFSRKRLPSGTAHP